MAQRWNLSRQQLDAYGLESHERAARAQDAGLFDGQITPVDTGEATVNKDEGIRRTTTMEALAGLRPAFRADGRITAGTAPRSATGRRPC